MMIFRMFHREKPQDGLEEFVRLLQKNADLLREVQEEGYPPQEKYVDSDDSDTEEKMDTALQKKIYLFLQTIHAKTSNPSPANVIQIILYRIAYFVKAGANLNDKIEIKEPNGECVWKTITYVLLMQFSHFSFAEKILNLGGNPRIFNSDDTNLFSAPPKGRRIFMGLCWLNHNLPLAFTQPAELSRFSRKRGWERA